MEGRKKATTFFGFCGHHDTEIFKPIELKDYTVGDQEQNFLFAYRAIAQKYYKALFNHKAFERQYEIIKRGDLEEIRSNFPELNEKYLDEIKEHVLGQEYHGYRIVGKKYLDSLKKTRISININLDKKRFHKIGTDVIELDREYPITVSTLCPIYFDVEGNAINYLNKSPNVKNLFLTIFPQGGKTYILLSYLMSERNTFNFIKK